MVGCTITKQIGAPRERVFATATDLRNAVGRVRAISELEVLTDGPIRQGTRFRETRRMFGRDATEEMEIVAFDPPRSFTLGCDSHGCRYWTEMRFTERDGGTELEMRFEVQALTLVSKIMGILMRPFMKTMVRECAQDLDDIAAHAEGRPPMR